MAVIGITNNHTCFAEVHQRIDLLCFLFADKLKRTTDLLGAAFHMAEPLFFKLGEADTQTSRAMESGCFAGFSRDNFVVQLHRVLMNLRDSHIAV